MSTVEKKKNKDNYLKNHFALPPHLHTLEAVLSISETSNKQHSKNKNK